MSLDDLDKVISESDPEALANIEGVRKIAEEIGQPLEMMEADALSLDPDAEVLRKKQNLKSRLKLKTILFWVWSKSFLKEAAKKSLVWSKEKKKNFKEASQKYKHWPTKSKLLLQNAIGLSIIVIVFAYFAFVKGSLLFKQEAFMASLEFMAEQKWEVKPDSEEKETFYNSPRILKNIFNLKKIVVNIQPSESSGPNPMVAFEFSLDGNSVEALLEIKDREGEILDQVQQTIEAYSFDELNETEGKKSLTNKIKAVINRLLTLGKIRQVYIQGIILKP